MSQKVGPRFGEYCSCWWLPHCCYNFPRQFSQIRAHFLSQPGICPLACNAPAFHQGPVHDAAKSTASWEQHPRRASASGGPMTSLSTTSWQRNLEFWGKTLARWLFCALTTSYTWMEGSQTKRSSLNRTLLNEQRHGPPDSQLIIVHKQN